LLHFTEPLGQLLANNALIYLVFNFRISLQAIFKAFQLHYPLRAYVLKSLQDTHAGPSYCALFSAYALISLANVLGFFTVIATRVAYTSTMNRIISFVTSLTVLLGLASCTNAVEPQPPAPIVGSIELPFDFSQSGMAMPVFATSFVSAGTIRFTPSSFAVIDAGALRYLNATFTVTNSGNTSINNLTLYALSKPDGNIGGTALKNISNFANMPLSSPAIAQAVKPIHGMGNLETINTEQADFQGMSSSEVATLRASALATNPPIIGMNDQVLEYGYVARSSSGRSIAANGGTGTITIGLRVPKTIVNDEPYRFAMTFLVGSDANTRVTRSREETTAQAQARLNQLSGTNKQLLLIGPERSQVNCNSTSGGVNTLCLDNIKTSTVNTTAANLYRNPNDVGFTTELVKDQLGVPWSLHVRTNGFIYYTVRDSNKVNLNILNPSSNSVQRLEANNSVRDEGEGGVLGMDFDPDFATNNKIYICYSYYKNSTVTNSNRRNRVSSFIIQSGVLNNEAIILDDMLGWSNHNGCRVVVGPDQKLYVSMGDAANFSPGPIKAQNLSSNSSKIFRINLDGSVPSDNPYASDANLSVKTTWTFGHRNPQGLAFHPFTGQLWSTEHGQNTRDELNLIEAGKNYGWPRCVGTQGFGSNLNVSADGTTYNCNTDTNNAPNLTSSLYKPAIKEYDSGSTVALSDISFYNSVVFPEWRGNLLMVSLKTGRLYRVTLNGSTVASEQILVNNLYGRLRDVTTGPDGFIYFSSDDGEIYRIKPS
jgi:aldose sugar dehydrogenase